MAACDLEQCFSLIITVRTVAECDLLFITH